MKYSKKEKQGPDSKILYPARLLFKIEGEIKSFPEKQKTKGVHYNQTCIARNVKGTAVRRRNRERNIGIKNKNGNM